MRKSLAVVALTAALTGGTTALAAQAYAAPVQAEAVLLRLQMQVEQLLDLREPLSARLGDRQCLAAPGSR